MSSWSSLEERELVPTEMLEAILEQLAPVERVGELEPLFSSRLFSGRARRKFRARFVAAVDDADFRNTLERELKKLPAIVERIANYVRNKGPGERSGRLWEGSPIDWVCAVPRLMVQHHFEMRTAEKLKAIKRLQPFPTFATRFLAASASAAEQRFFDSFVDGHMQPCFSGAVLDTDQAFEWFDLGVGSYFYAQDVAAPKGRDWTADDVDMMRSHTKDNYRVLRARLAHLDDETKRGIHSQFGRQRWQHTHAGRTQP